MQERFTKKDWILFQSKIAGWQEAYKDRLNQEYLDLLNGKASPSEKFWALEKRIKEDKKKKSVLIHISRSDLIYNVVS